MWSAEPSSSLLLVRVRETRAHAEHDRERMLERELEHALLLHLADDGAQVLAVDVLHRDEVLIVVLTDVEDLDDVRMRERRGDACFVEQHLDERFVLVHRRKDPLDDEELLETGDALLDREEQLGHAAGRELADQRVLAESTRHAIHSERVADHLPEAELGGDDGAVAHPNENPSPRGELGQSRGMWVSPS